MKNKKESFIEKSNKKHNGKYDYSKVEYKNYKTEVEIICKEHGSFWMIPMNHLKGCNCQKCSHEKTVNKRRLTLKNFIERANKIHNNKYNYTIKVICCSRSLMMKLLQRFKIFILLINRF